jgi:GNAT superfamily N-acetyltransferase
MRLNVERIGTSQARLRDGTELLIRQVGPDDKQLLADGLRRLSPESRYRRFFRPLDRFSERDLAYLTEIDHGDHEALAAIDPQTSDLVGVARYVRGAEPHLAEVSVVVGDDWHRRGVATLLLERLVERARAAGITHFTALVMDGNVDAISLFERRVPGQAGPRRSASGHLELVMELPAPGGLRGLHPGARATGRGPHGRGREPLSRDAPGDPTAARRPGPPYPTCRVGFALRCCSRPKRSTACG